MLVSLNFIDRYTLNLDDKKHKLVASELYHTYSSWRMIFFIEWILTLTFSFAVYKCINSRWRSSKQANTWKMSCISSNGMHIRIDSPLLSIPDCFLLDTNDTLCNPQSYSTNPMLYNLPSKIMLKYPKPRVTRDGYVDLMIECNQINQNTTDIIVRMPVGNPNQAGIVGLVTVMLPILAFIIIITAPLVN